VKRLGVVLAVLACVVPNPAPAARPVPQDTTPVWSWDARRIAFSRETATQLDSTSKVLTIAAGGRGGTRLTSGGKFRAGVPQAWRNGGNELAVAVDSGLSLLTMWWGAQIATLYGGYPSWSPNGAHLAYLRGSSLVVGGPYGEAPQPIAADARGAPVWSPDGGKLAYRDVEGRLVVVDADGAGEHVVAPAGDNPSWSPDGKALAFESDVLEPGRWTIWSVEVDGSRLTPLFPGPWNTRRVTWKPVGSVLAFISDRERVPGGATPFQYALFSASPEDDRPPRKLADDVHPFSPVRWSPTGAQIAYAAGRECNRWGIYDQNPELRRERRLTNLCRFQGDSGRNVLRGTPYPDFINAGGGNDLVLARDGARDTIDCGPGTDVARVDRIDIVEHCEHVRRPR
jgi:dipeptidyl aminopeptidase/acylaminoacyl peptidase